MPYIWLVITRCPVIMRILQAKKHVEDKTFGLKNKNKSKKVQVRIPLL